MEQPSDPALSAADADSFFTDDITDDTANGTAGSVPILTDAVATLVQPGGVGGGVGPTNPTSRSGASPLERRQTDGEYVPLDARVAYADPNVGSVADTYDDGVNGGTDEAKLAVVEEGHLAQRKRRKCIWYTAGGIFLLIILVQAVVVGFLVSDKRKSSSGGSSSSNDNNNDNSSAATSSPTADGQFNRSSTGPPTEMTPPSAVTDLPTATPTLSGRTTYRSIASIPGASRLIEVSDCDECNQQVMLASPFMLRGTVVDQILVTSNGEIILPTCEGYDQDPCGIIRAAVVDLDTSLGGDIWIKHNNATNADNDGDSSSVSATSKNSDGNNRRLPDDRLQNPFDMSHTIVSWEDVVLRGEPETSIQFQATLFESGDVQICYGTARIQPFETVEVSMQDYREHTIVHPTPDTIFTTGGRTRNGAWPTDECIVFTNNMQYSKGDITNVTIDDASGEDTRAPSTLLPSAAPTETPDNPHPLATTFKAITESGAGVQWLSAVSSCSLGCSERLPLNFNFMWKGSDAKSTVDVLTDGAILLTNGGVIDVVSTNLDISLGGNIWARLYPDYAIVSWQNLRLAGSTDAFVNAQTYLHANGDVDLCYGSGQILGYSFQAGLSDTVDQSRLPAKGFSFDSEGMTKNGQFPSDSCQRLSSSELRSSTITTSQPTMNQPTISPHDIGSPSVAPVAGGNTSSAPTTAMTDDLGATTPPTVNDPIETIQSAMYMHQMESIKNHPDATKVQWPATCDGCSETVQLQFDLHWLNQSATKVQQIIVSEDGFVQICVPNDRCYGDILFNLGMADSRAPEEVYLLHRVSNPRNASITISWESDGPNSALQQYKNAQLTITTTGAILMCWGEGSVMSSTTSVTSKITNYVTGISYHPLGQMFTSVGSMETWPTNQCQHFQFRAPHNIFDNAPTVTPSQLSGTGSPSSGSTNDGSHNNQSETIIDLELSDMYEFRNRPLRDEPGAYQLSSLSACSGTCVDSVSLDFPVYWLNQSHAPFHDFIISSRGSIEVCSSRTGCIGSFGAIVNTRRSLFGDVYVLVNSTNPDNPRLTIGWESVVFGSSSRNKITAQATIFGNGTITMCWGSLEEPGQNTGSVGGSIYARVDDDANSEVYAGDPPFFDSFGFVEIWPSNLCQNWHFSSIEVGASDPTTRT